MSVRLPVPTYHRCGPLLFLVVVHGLLKLREIKPGRENGEVLSSACVCFKREYGGVTWLGLRDFEVGWWEALAIQVFRDRCAPNATPVRPRGCRPGTSVDSIRCVTT